MFNDFHVIDSYSQQQAVEDGILANLSELFPIEIKECGINIPLFCTSSVFENYIKLTPTAERALNDEKGRAWDLIFMSKQALKAAAKTGNKYYFKFYCVVKRIKPTLCTCKVVYDGHSFTILETDED